MHLRTSHAPPPRTRNRALSVVGATVLSLWLPAPAGASGTPRRVLVLGISEQGKQQEALRRALGSKVERSGALLVSDSGLSDDRRSCDDPGCLRGLAQEFGADLLLSARLERHGRFEQLLDLWIFDAATNRDLSGKNLCDSRLPEPCVTELCGRLLAQLLDGNVPQSPPRRKPSETTATPLSKLAAAPLPPYRLALGIGLSIAAATSLGIGIGYSVMRGQPTDGQCPSPGTAMGCAIDGSAQLSAGYALFGLSTAAAIATLAWPHPTSPKKEMLR